MIPILPKREFLLLGKAYRELDQSLRLPDEAFYTVREKISLWSIAQHIHHLGITNKEYFENIEVLYRDRAPEILPSGRPSWLGYRVLTFGSLPRGRKAPARLQPPPEVMREEVTAAFQESKKAMTSLAPRAGALDELTGRLERGAFGKLRATQLLKISRIHTQHHLATVERIGKALKSGPAT